MQVLNQPIPWLSCNSHRVYVSDALACTRALLCERSLSRAGFSASRIGKTAPSLVCLFLLSFILVELIGTMNGMGKRGGGVLYATSLSITGRVMIQQVIVLLHRCSSSS